MIGYHLRARTATAVWRALPREQRGKGARATRRHNARGGRESSGLRAAARGRGLADMAESDYSGCGPVPAEEGGRRAGPAEDRFALHSEILDRCGGRMGGRLDRRGRRCVAVGAAGSRESTGPESNQLELDRACRSGALPAFRSVATAASCLTDTFGRVVQSQKAESIQFPSLLWSWEPFKIQLRRITFAHS